MGKKAVISWGNTRGTKTLIRKGKKKEGEKEE